MDWWLLPFGLCLLVAGPTAGDDSEPLLLAHYMPWYVVEKGEDGSQAYGWHWTMNHFDPSKSADGQQELASHYHPLISPYDSGDRHVIEFHLLTMQLAGIDGVIVDWYGRTDLHDYVTLHRNTTRILEECERLGLKFVICYEDQTLGPLAEAGKITGENRVQHAADEIAWLTKYWFRSPSYVRIEDRPVLLSFGSDGLSDDEWTACLERIDTPIAYFSEHRKRPAAVGAYDWPVPSVGLEMQNRFANAANNWPMAIPAAYPRFVDIYAEAGVSDGYAEIDDNRGRTFRKTLNRALAMKSPIIQIATWNDWGEGTQIEPSVEFGYRDLETLQTLRNIEVDADDLRIPYELLKRRRNHPEDTLELDAIAELLSQRDINRASVQLEQLPQ